MNPSIFKAYDIRGHYPEDINKETIIPIIKAIHTILKRKAGKENMSIALGRDMRISSPELYEVAVKTLTDMGVEVYSLGLVSTPTVYFAVMKYGTDAGIQISASHNPAGYNGFKFAYQKDGVMYKISKDTGMEDVKKLAISNVFEEYKGKKGTVIEKKEALIEEVNAAAEFVGLTKTKKFKIVADPANAMGVVFLEELFKKFPVDLVRMNFTLDGSFPAHQADPLQFKLLKELQDKVISENADFGIAPDGDGDRVFFIDEKGEVIPATHITALITKELLSSRPHSKILVDIRYTKNAEDVCKKYNGTPVISRVGHALITEQLNSEGAIFAGESSGHYYFKETGGAESSIRVILMLMKVLNREQKPLSEILKEFHTSFESGEYNFKLPIEVPATKVIEEILTRYRGAEVSKLDGVALSFSDWRCSIRTSNTEPLLRLNVESTSQELTDKMRMELVDIIQSVGGKPV